MTHVETDRTPPVATHVGSVTLFVIAVNVLVFAVMTVAGVSPFDPSGEQLTRWGGNVGPLTLGGQWWRLLTSMFVHAGVLHLGFNMWALLNLGPVAEVCFERRGVVPLYLLSGLSGGVTSLLAHPYGASVGASGAIFGLAGGLIVATLLRRGGGTLQDHKVLFSLVVFVLYNLIAGFLDPVTDNAAHVGGLICGMAFGAALLVRGKDSHPSGRRIIVVGSLFTVGLVLNVATLTSALPLVERELPGWGRSRFNDTPSMPDDMLALRIPPADSASTKALTDSITALERSPGTAGDSTVRMLELGRLYLQAGRIPDAIALLDRTTRARPLDPKAWRLDGTAHLEAQQVDEAIVAYERVVQLEPADDGARSDLAVATLARGRVRAASGDRTGALADFKAVIDLKADAALTMAARQERQALQASQR